MKTKHLIAILLFIGISSCTFLLMRDAGEKRPLDDSARHQKIMEMYEAYRKSFPEVEDLQSGAVLKRLEAGDVLFVDVRDPEEQAISMLPGAITDETFLKNPEHYRDRLIIGYCTISYRSGKLAQGLRKKGIHMVNLQGGILAWLHAGGQVYREGKKVKSVHVYGSDWDLAPSAYESVW